MVRIKGPGSLTNAFRPNLASRLSRDGPAQSRRDGQTRIVSARCRHHPILASRTSLACTSHTPRPPDPTRPAPSAGDKYASQIRGGPTGRWK